MYTKYFKCLNVNLALKEDSNSHHHHKHNKVVDLKTYLDTTRMKIFLQQVDPSKIQE